MYIAYALIFLVVAGIEALLIRIQLFYPHNHFVSPHAFNRMFTMHGTTMVFLVGMPILFGFGNYLVPLMIGARDMAFPRLNAFSFWISAFGGTAALLQLYRRQWTVRARAARPTWLVRLCAADGARFSPGHSTDYWTMALLVERLRQHRHGDQHHRHGVLHALQGHDAVPHAAAAVALCW